jgi:hypothetical protein
MAAKHSTRAAKAQSRSESPTAEAASEFHELHGRLMSILGQVQCADAVLYDLQDVPEDLQPAAITLHAAAEALDRFYTDLDAWHVHRHAQERDFGARSGQPLRDPAADEHG